MNYSICWVAFTVLFNIVCFVTPEELFGFDKFGGSFWTGYAFTMIFMVIHYVFIYKLTNSNNNMTVNNTLMVMSYLEAALMVTVSIACMLIPDLPNWSSIVVCSFVLALSIIFTITTNTVTSKTVKSYEAMNEKTKAKRELTAKAELLMKKARGTDKEELAKRIYEEIRYGNQILNENKYVYDEKIIKMIDSNEINEELFELINKRNRR